MSNNRGSALKGDPLPGLKANPERAAQARTVSAPGVPG